jgi:hypothetical protein
MNDGWWVMGPDLSTDCQENPYKASVGRDVIQRDMVLRDVVRRDGRGVIGGASLKLCQGWGVTDEARLEH